MHEIALLIGVSSERHDMVKSVNRKGKPAPTRRQSPQPPVPARNRLNPAKTGGVSARQDFALGCRPVNDWGSVEGFMAGPEDMSETGADAGIVRDFGDDVRLPAAAHPPRRARGVFARLSGMFSPFSRRRGGDERPEFDLESPLKSLFAQHGGVDQGGDFALGQLLQQAARKIEDGKAALSAQARDLVDAISARRGGEISLIAHSLRLLIALAWAVFAFRLDRAVLTAMAEGQPLIVTLLGTMPITDAQILARVFMLLAGAGVAAAFLGSWLVMATGGASNAKLRVKSAAFGAEAADLAKAFDADLNRLRDQMERRPLSSPDAAEDLSRMHLT
ncbi:MAG: hypothetical protein KDA46_06610, partial [Parvularculaceae bacterium]|nr:hypothetical protein [Parvularculaceae bacterium]